MSIATALTVEFETKEEARAFLQHVRDFDVARNMRHHFNIMMIAPDLRDEEVQAIFDSVDPPFDLRASFPKQ